MRTGTRWVTLTQLPLAFCAGSTENSLPVPAPIDATWPLSLRPGIGVELDLGGLADRHLGEVAFLEIGFDPGLAVADNRQHGEPGDRDLADQQAVGLGDDADRRRADHVCARSSRALSTAARAGAIAGWFRPAPSRLRHCWTRAGVGQLGFGLAHLVERVVIVGPAS